VKGKFELGMKNSSSSHSRTLFHRRYYCPSEKKKRSSVPNSSFSINNPKKVIISNEGSEEDIIHKLHLVPTLADLSFLARTFEVILFQHSFPSFSRLLSY